MNILTQKWPPLLAILLCAAGGLIALPYLPPRIPVRWGLLGEIITYSSKQKGIYLNPGAMVIAYLFFTLIPYSDKRRVFELREIGIYDPFRNAAVYAFGFAQLLSIGIGLGLIPETTNYGVGVLSLLLGMFAAAFRSGLTEPLEEHFRLLGDASPETRRRLSLGIYLAAIVGFLSAFLAPYPLLWPSAILVVAVVMAYRVSS